MYLKIHEKEGKRVIALCDKDLLGNVYSEGGVEIDLDTYSSFYRGKVVGKEEAVSLLKEFDSLNVVGKSAVALCIELKLGEIDDVRYVQGVPILQIYVI